MILSILVCHLKDRDASFKPLEDKIMKQIMKSGAAVELLVNSDGGEAPVGRKRNALLHQAQGEYIVFVDDDDDVADNYLALILDALKDKPDCLGIEGFLIHQGKQYPFKHSIEYQCWYTGADGFYRTPNHLNPVKRSIAVQVGFREQNTGEDRLYSDQVRHYLKTEQYIEQPIYFYKK